MAMIPQKVRNTYNLGCKCFFKRKKKKHFLKSNPRFYAW